MPPVFRGYLFNPLEIRYNRHMNTQEILSKLKIDYSKRFAVAVCIGPLPDDPALSQIRYDEKVSTELALFDHISSIFRKKKIGSEIDRNAGFCRLMCTFPLDQRNDFAETSIRPLFEKAEKEANMKLLCGIGIPSANQLHLKESLSTAKEAFEFYFFSHETFYDYQKSRKRFEASFEDYESYSEKAFKSILMKSPDAINNIDKCLDLIERIHYGNKSAVVMRAMNFTGETAYRLHRYNILAGDFYQLQDALQEKVLSANTYAEVKRIIHEYYQAILSDIYSNSPNSKRTMVEQAKTYIKDNYMENLTVKELASIACVTPGYFSRSFKEETGKTCKTYLTDVRLDAAMDLLLGSDFRLYEISEQIGYNNVRNFEEAFRKKYGCFPGEYKKKMMKKNQTKR